MIYAIIGAAAVITALLIAAGNNIFSVSRYEIRSGRVQKERRILFVSDIHSKNVRGRLVKIALKHSPDAVVIAGDMWDRHRPDGRPEETAAALASFAPVFYTPGNHDYSYPDRERMFTDLKKRGVSVLKADRALPFPDLEITGFDRLSMSAFSKDLYKRKSGSFRVVLTHYPQYFEEDSELFDADLILAGHAHGGQFRIPFAHIGLYAPGQGVFPKYSEGLHEKNGVKMIVSRGIGNSSSFPFRLFNRPEAVIIRVLPEDEA